MNAGVRRLAASALLVVAAALLIFAAPTGATDTGWIIERFACDIEVQPDGGLLITEAIDVDFQLLNDRHGIFRDIPVHYQWDPAPNFVRVYQINVQSVRDASGRGLKYETSQNGANLQIKIGDANRIVVGKQTYRITYSVRGALNPFADHDELFWNDGDVFRGLARLQEAVPELGLAAARGVQRDDRAPGGAAAHARHRDAERRSHRSRADPGAPRARR
jgi:hypothetical protein